MRTAMSTVTLGLLLAPPLCAQVQDPATAALACFSNSWNGHDMQAFGRCFASDADFVNVNTRWWQGREALERNHAYMHGVLAVDDKRGITVPERAHGMFKDTVIAFTNSHTRYLNDDVALVHAAWEITGDPRSPETRKGLMLIVLTREQGQWQIESVQNTELNRTVR